MSLCESLRLSQGYCMVMVVLSFSLSWIWGGPWAEVGYFYGSSVALEMGFGGSHRLQTDFRMDSIDELGGGYFHLLIGPSTVLLPFPIGKLKNVRSKYI